MIGHRIYYSNTSSAYDSIILNTNGVVFGKMVNEFEVYTNIVNRILFNVTRVVKSKIEYY
jgi:hypothetical protein